MKISEMLVEKRAEEESVSPISAAFQIQQWAHFEIQRLLWMLGKEEGTAQKYLQNPQVKALKAKQDKIELELLSVLEELGLKKRTIPKGYKPKAPVNVLKPIE